MTVCKINAVSVYLLLYSSQLSDSRTHIQVHILFFTEVFAEMIAAVVAPDKLCVLWGVDLYLKPPHTH